MDWLIFLVIGVGDEHRAQTTEGKHAVRLPILDRLAFAGRPQGKVIGLRIGEIDRKLAAEQCTEAVQCRAEIARRTEFFIQP